jgi:hypothetical protein
MVSSTFRAEILEANHGNLATQPHQTTSVKCGMSLPGYWIDRRPLRDPLRPNSELLGNCREPLRTRQMDMTYRRKIPQFDRLAVRNRPRRPYEQHVRVRPE